MFSIHHNSEQENTVTQRHTYARPPLIPTNLNTPPTSPDLPSTAPYSSVGYAPFGLPTGGITRGPSTKKEGSHNNGDSPPRGGQSHSQSRIRRLRNVKSQPLLNRASSGSNVKPANIRHIPSVEGLRRKTSGLLATRGLSSSGVPASSSVPEAMNALVEPSSIAGRKRRRLPRRNTETVAPVFLGPPVAPSRPEVLADVFTSNSPPNNRQGKSVPPLSVLPRSTSSRLPFNEDDSAPSSEQDEGPAALDPKIVFSKERFLRSHSRDFGHLYSTNPNPMAPKQDERMDKPRDSDMQRMESAQERHERLVQESRKEGRERRRSWMLAKAGLSLDEPSSSSVPNHRRRSSVLGGYATPRVDVARPMNDPATRRMLRQSVDLRSQPVLAGGPRPLSLVASQDLKKRLSAMGVVQPPAAALANDVTHAQVAPVLMEEPEEMSVVMEEPVTTPRPSLEIDHRNRLGMGQPGHSRNPSSLSIPYAGTTSRRSSPSGSIPPPSAYTRSMNQAIAAQYSAASPAGSMNSTPPRSQIPPHLRNFSTSSTGSSLSSLGAIIGESPGASSSSCSSGADHLGGPRELAPESFNFRMSAVERSSSLRNGFQGRSESRLTTSSVGGLIAPGSLRTNSRMTLRGSVFDNDTNRASLIEDKHERTRRRRARAFLVAGLKLEKGSLDRSSAITIEQDEEEDEVLSDGQDAEEKHGRRHGLVMEQNDELTALANVQETAPPREPISPPPPPSATSSRKRYSVIRREKMAAYVQPTASEGPRDHPPRAPTPLLSLYLQPGRSAAAPLETDGEISSVAASYHTARQSTSRTSRHSSRMSDIGLPSLAEAPGDTARQPFTSDVSVPSEISMPISAADVTPLRQTLRRVKRFEEVAGPSQEGHTNVIIASTDPLSGPGITISLFESGSDQESATIESGSYDDHSIDTMSSESVGRDSGLLAPEESPALTTLEDSTQGWGRGINSEELARELFWRSEGEGEGESVHAPITEPMTDVASIRQVRSDACLGASYRQGSSPSMPISPSFVHADSAGTSPGRVHKEGWSKGVRTWLTGGVKATVEGDMEKGFGDGRGGDVRKTPVSPQMQAVATSADQTLREKKSWRPFLVGRRRRRGSLPEAFSLGQINSMAPSVRERETTRMEAVPSGPIRCLTAPGLRTPMQTETWMHQQQKASPTLLSPPLFPHHSFTRPNGLYSPSSAGSFSPATPELLSTMTSPGMRVEETPSPPIQAGIVRSPLILSPTPGYSPVLNHQHYPTVPAKSVWRPYISTAGLSTATDGSIGRRKSPQSILPTLANPWAAVHLSKREDSRRPHILHGLGFHVPWEGIKVDRKGKGKMLEGLEHDATHQSPDVTVPEPAATPRGAAPITFEIRPPTSYETSAEQQAAPPSAGLLSPSIYSSITRIQSEQGSSLLQGDTLVDLDPRIRQALIKNAYKSRASLGDYRAAMSDTDSLCSNVSYAAHGDVLPAKLLFMLGFLLGPWVWLIGGWGLSPAGCFFSSTPRIPLHHLLIRKPIPRPVFDPTAMPPFPSKHGLELIPPLKRDHPDKWVTRNRWAAVVSSAVFIPAMCVGFAFVGAYV